MAMDAALLLSIIENPDDDAPRLIYADWLEEHNDPARAEFIRIQIELAQLFEEDPRRPDLTNRLLKIGLTVMVFWAAIT